jgi:hypothetical protein
MPGSQTTPGCPALAIARLPYCLPRRQTRRHPELCLNFAARWLAYALPCRRFAIILADTDARLGASVDRYSFTVVDFHHLLLAGFAGALSSQTRENRGWRDHATRSANHLKRLGIPLDIRFGSAS